MVMSIQAIRGMNDLLPQDTSVWQQIETVLRSVVGSYGYSEVRMPVLEKTALFCRAIGEVTDVVEKEMYTFEDRSGDMLSLRPEGTAGCVRACLEHNLIYNQEQRLWYMGPMFRHERPQKGRYRQFHQLGCEVFGLEGPDVDAELIIMTAQIWKTLGIEKEVTLQLNTLGSKEERASYKKELVAFLEKNFDSLDEDSKRRTHTNPLRVLDSKDPGVIELLKNAPSLSSHFGEKTLNHFNELKALLDAAGVAYEINDRLVRGLDYYNYTVFEWVTTALGSQGTVCGGGRYDGLVEELGGTPTPAVGFGLGLERLILLLTTLDKVQAKAIADVYVIGQGSDIQKHLSLTASYLRSKLDGVRVMMHCGGGNFKKQFKKADRVGARVAVVLGDEEIAKNQVTLKDMTDKDAQQMTVALNESIELIGRILNK